MAVLFEMMINPYHKKMMKLVNQPIKKWWPGGIPGYNMYNNKGYHGLPNFLIYKACPKFIYIYIYKGSPFKKKKIFLVDCPGVSFGLASSDAKPHNAKEFICASRRPEQKKTAISTAVFCFETEGHSMGAVFFLKFARGNDVLHHDFREKMVDIQISAKRKFR